ncbi:hypothetical protein [Prosthecobacter sp.]|uniref:hypothetical protein n=1 Tax=Prosthecobacter sp. TaxID=1965333 RepID=UPI002AB9DB98|nr:hypothetical protein [Prosthecobacter sp.]MDZ4404220.1 hypothetical protein [Prosthecobacter sp.]
MTDGQTLFAVFALLYLIECLRLMPSTAWMAAGSVKSRWSTIRPWMRFQIAGGSPLLLSAWPPLQAHTLALPWLFIPEHEVLRVRLTDRMIVNISWEKLALRVEEATLHLDSATSVRLASSAQAQTWLQRLAEWRDLAPEKRRDAFLQHARASLDTQAAKQTAAEAAKRTRSLRRLATLHFIWCFGVISVIYHRFGDSLLVLGGAAVLLVLQIIQSWLFLCTTRQMKALIPYRRWRALGIAFLPQLAMRAADVVSLATNHEPPHPLAWRVLLDEKFWLQTARQFWREARYVPGWSHNDSMPPEAEALQTFFRHENIAEADYDPPSAAKLPVCPRCGAEFQTGIATCKDCGGVELRNPAA